MRTGWTMYLSQVNSAAVDAWFTLAARLRRIERRLGRKLESVGTSIPLPTTNADCYATAYCVFFAFRGFPNTGSMEWESLCEGDELREGHRAVRAALAEARAELAVRDAMQWREEKREADYQYLLWSQEPLPYKPAPLRIQDLWTGEITTYEGVLF